MSSFTGKKRDKKCSRYFMTVLLDSVPDDSLEADEPAAVLEGQDSHPTGIVLHRVGYYTIPSLDELVCHMRDDGSCVVDNFTVGREGYGNVYFLDSFDVADLNLDEIGEYGKHRFIIIISPVSFITSCLLAYCKSHSCWVPLTHLLEQQES
jgi:hypothetical protein